jgi:hypothetical protein
VTQDFGDFDDDDVVDESDPMAEVNWDAVTKLQARYDEIAVLPTAQERKIAAKALVRELNGEDSGPILVT